MNYQSTLIALKTVEVHSVEWILPDFRHGASSTETIDEYEFSADYLTLGKKLLERMPTDYYPKKYLSTLGLIAKGFHATEEDVAAMDRFFSEVRAADLLTRFFEKYGIPTYATVFAADYSGSDISAALRAYADAVLPEYGPRGLAPSGLEWPSAVLAEFVVPLYLCAVEPQKCAAMLKRAGIPSVELPAAIRRTAVFDADTRIFQKTIIAQSLFDYATFLILQNPDFTTRTCPHCGRLFVPRSPASRALYCTPRCQNNAKQKRFQSKKSTR